MRRAIQAGRRILIDSKPGSRATGKVNRHRSISASSMTALFGTGHLAGFLSAWQLVQAVNLFLSNLQSIMKVHKIDQSPNACQPLYRPSSRQKICMIYHTEVAAVSSDFACKKAHAV